MVEHASFPPRSRAHYQGCSFSYFVAGDGEPVVMVQGMGVGADGWLPQVGALSAEYRVLSFDNRGFGASQPIGVPLTIAQMAADVIAMMDAQKWDRVHLVGHSIGGLIALQVAITYPSRVRSLALLCTFASGKVPTGFRPKIVWVGMRTRIGSRRMRRNAFLEMVMPARVLASADRDALAAELAPLFGHDLGDQPPVVMKQFAATRRSDVTSRIGEISVPTLVVSAAGDIIAPPFAGRALAKGIRGARYVEIPDAAHGVTIQRADEINSLLLDHLRSS